ncbi:glutamyl-tRNA reductase [Virgibacillus halophilus]|uniref:glutamyl-tRNA reductase n=1 Tax=Tigheibacillus halophilus TaxID=361280 RepID=UPI00364534F2
MHVLKVGFNHKTAPVEIREKMAFSDSTLDQAMRTLKEQKSILENVILSTCNRTEIFAVVDQLHTGRYYVKQFMENWFQIEKNVFAPYLQIEENDDAVSHLLRLVCGLDSMVLGETQILGQVKQAFLTAQKLQTTGTIFNELFKQAITFGKKAQHETAIGESAVSVSYAAVELAKKIFGGIDNKRVLIIGAGKMGELTAKNLHGSGASDITVINRTHRKAIELAKQFQAKAAPFEKLDDSLLHADILISSTGSSHTVLEKADLLPVMKQRKGRPLCIVDIAVPRDADPAINELENVFLYDIDDLQHIVDENLAARKQAAEQIEASIGKEIASFNEWVKMLGVVPVITALRKKALKIQADTMQSIERKMPDLTDREKKVLSKHTKSIINQLLKTPITQAKEMAALDHAEDKLSLLVHIFGIEDELQDEKNKQTQAAEKKQTIFDQTKKTAVPSIDGFPVN